MAIEAIKQMNLFEESKRMFICNLCKEPKNADDHYDGNKSRCKKCVCKKVKERRAIHGRYPRGSRTKENKKRRAKNYLKKNGTIKGFEKYDSTRLLRTLKNNLAKSRAKSIETKQAELINLIKKHTLVLVDSVGGLRDALGNDFFLEFVKSNLLDVWSELPWSSKDRYFLKYHLDVGFNISERLRRQVKKALKRDGVMDLIRSAANRNGNSPKVCEELGFTIPEFRERFENLFQEGMTWEKFTNGEIHIDHIIPQSFFDCSCEEEYKECFSLKNLQPLWAEDNLNKSNKTEWRKNEHRH